MQETLILNENNTTALVNQLPIAVRQTMDNVLNHLCIKYLIHKELPNNQHLVVIAFDEELKTEINPIFSIFRRFGFTSKFMVYNQKKKVLTLLLTKAKFLLN